MATMAAETTVETLTPVEQAIAAGVDVSAAGDGCKARSHALRVPTPWWQANKAAFVALVVSEANRPDGLTRVVCTDGKSVTRIYRTLQAEQDGDEAPGRARVADVAMLRVALNTITQMSEGLDNVPKRVVTILASAIERLQEYRLADAADRFNVSRASMLTSRDTLGMLTDKAAALAAFSKAASAGKAAAAAVANKAAAETDIRKAVAAFESAAVTAAECVAAARKAQEAKSMAELPVIDF